MKHHFVGVTAMLLTLAGCAHAPPPPPAGYEPVPVAVAGSCIPKTLGPRPAGLETPSSLAAIPTGPRRYTRLYADWKALYARALETEPVLADCR